MRAQSVRERRIALYKSINNSFRTLAVILVSLRVFFVVVVVTLEDVYELQLNQTIQKVKNVHTHTHKKKRVSNWTVRKFVCFLQYPVTKSVFVFRFYTTYF